jgi:citrate lyase subunit beta/citryl-CoA lyase
MTADLHFSHMHPLPPPNPPIRLERSVLFVPASRWDMIQKAAASAADAVCIDLEDSVAPDAKAASRANVVRAFAELDFGRRLRAFRINALDTPYSYRDVIEVVEAAGDRVELLMLPKTRGPQDVAFVDMLLTQIEAGRRKGAPIGIEAQIETVHGFLNAREIAQASPRLEALIFGSGDYAASARMPLANIGAFDESDTLYPGHRWHAVMHTIVAAARANGLRCVDGPYAAYTDRAGLERAARIARAMGFDGKQCIHPAQLEPVNAIFAPQPVEVAWAKMVTEACERAQATGQGAISVNGAMVDAASIRMARVVVERDRLIQQTTRGARQQP